MLSDVAGRCLEGVRSRAYAFYARARSLRAPSRRLEPDMTTWEYLTTPLLIHNTAAILNNWGKQGWELVQVVPGPEGGLVAYFKRPTGGGTANAGLGAAEVAARQFEGQQ
jgi:hypothetical protein